MLLPEQEVKILKLDTSRKQNIHKLLRCVKLIARKKNHLKDRKCSGMGAGLMKEGSKFPSDFVIAVFLSSCLTVPA